MTLAAAAPSPEGKTIAVHLMPVMSPGAEYANASEHVLGWKPSEPRGPLATYAPEFLTHYRKPLQAAQKDVRMIREMGANAIGLCYNMPGNSATRPDQFNSIFNAYCQAMLDDGFVTFFPDVWGFFDQNNLTRNITNLAGEFAYLKERYERAWLKKDGKYVVFLHAFDRPEALPSAPAILNIISAGVGGNENVHWVTYDARQFTEPDYFFGPAPRNPEWLAASSAISAWPNDSYGFVRKMIAADLDFATRAGKNYWLPIFPAFAQARGWPDGPWNTREMLGIANFIASWKEALNNNIHEVYLLTWNDLTEDSAFMPESNHGHAYYELAKYFIAWFRSGKKPEIAEEKIFLFHHPQVVEGLQLPAGRKPMEGFPVAGGYETPMPMGTFAFPPVHRTPPTDYIAVVGMLKESARIRVMLNERVLAERELPVGLNSWLIYQPRHLNDSRGWYPRDEGAYPSETDDFFITLLAHPLRDAEVHVEVIRSGDRMGFFRSHRPIVDAAGRGEMVTIGNVFSLGKHR